MSSSDDQNNGRPQITISGVPAEPPPVHQSVFARLRNYFLTGLILVGPIYITFSLTWWFINWVDDVMRPFIPFGLRAETYLPFKVPGYGLIIALSALTLLGFLAAGLVGRTLVEFSENLLNRMPVVRPIYKTMKQIFETLFSKSGSSFRKVALAQFPAGMWSVVFLSHPPGSEVASRLPEGDFVSCFLPCTPNPTTGFFFYAKREDLIELEITVEQAMTLIVSAGMVQPNADAQKKLASLIESGRSRHPGQAGPSAGSAQPPREKVD
jgi:uncharacterized membrane protein